MKKNISINISGIIFHIEEDGYENLRKYLDSINKYFSSFEDSSEILADIESRIAEIFLSKLSEGKQVITAEDVNALITTMGSVSDFKAAEDQDYEPTTASSQTSAEEPAAESAFRNTSARTEEKKYTKPKQLFRDQQRKVLGGVCAGLGNYLNIDPVWIRLFFALFAFAYGATLFAYLIMWIVVPGSYDLDEPEVEKKMFRDTENKVLGGVSGGVAAFLGIDIVAVRVLFVIFTLVGGVGFITYIVLWMILPEARTLTDRMKMQGEAVTLSNIESNIKKNLNVDEKKEDESALTKIVLFPFRVIGFLLTGLGRMLGPVFEFVRVIIGVCIVMFGMSLVFGSVVAGGMLFGLMSANAFSWIELDSIPLREINETFPSWIGIAGFVATLIPGIFIILLGSSVISKKIVFGPAVGWSLFGIFFICVALLSMGIPKIIYDNQEDGAYKIESHFDLIGKRAVFKLNEAGMDSYDGAHITIRGYDGKDFKLVQEFEAQGSTRKKAIENAQLVNYNFTLRDDSIFTFDSNISFKENFKLHWQRVNLELYIPYDAPFVLTEEFARSEFFRNNIDREYLDGHLWRMTPDGIDCLSCPVADGDPETREIEEERFDASDFDEIELHGAYEVEIHRGDDYAVELKTTSDTKNDYHFSNENDRLVLEYDGSWSKNLLNIKKVKVEITLPRLEKLKATGEGKIELRDFEAEDLDIILSGPVKLVADGNAKNIDISLSAKSEAEFDGTAENMEASIDGGSQLDAYSFEVKKATVEVHGTTSSAKVNATEELEMPQRSSNQIRYKGNPKVKKWN